MIIYQPRGRAREYANLAANLYTGCEHGCRYCYAPACLHMPPQKFHGRPEPRQDIFRKLKQEANNLPENEQEILLCFTCDPYQPIEEKHALTRSVLAIFATHNIPYTILTKGGRRAIRDFDILTDSRGRFGTTLLFLDESLRREWEPNATPIIDRIEAIQQAHEMGIPTWVSLEPVIDPMQAIAVIREIHPIVDLWKVGKLNHHPLQKQIDWTRFGSDFMATLLEVNARFIIKNDLQKYIKINEIGGKIDR